MINNWFYVFRGTKIPYEKTSKRKWANLQQETEKKS